MGRMKERAGVIADIEQMVADWTQFVDADDLTGNMVLSYVLANQDEICDLVLEKQKGAFYASKSDPM